MARLMVLFLVVTVAAACGRVSGESARAKEDVLTLHEIIASASRETCFVRSTVVYGATGQADSGWAILACSTVTFERLKALEGKTFRCATTSDPKRPDPGSAAERLLALPEDERCTS